MGFDEAEFECVGPHWNEGTAPGEQAGRLLSVLLLLPEPRWLPHGAL